MLTIVGGTYFEACSEPHYHELYGSGLRAACALSRIKEKVKLISCIGRKDEELAKLICNSFRVKHNYYLTKETVLFDYYHPLSNPSFFPGNVEEYDITLKRVSTKKILYYGMLEASVLVNCSYAVYDPQNGISFQATGSKAEHLALVLNRNEALLLSALPEQTSLEEVGKVLLQREQAEVVIIKNAAKGALVFEQERITSIPIFETSHVWPIGSGDIFSAAFAWQWMIERKSPSEAALLASQYTAFYCQHKILPLPTSLNYSLSALPIQIVTKTIYLAGPFFNVAERWLLNEARNTLLNLGNIVFSPLHDVGFGDSSEIATKDIEGLVNSEVVLAILNGLDAGTLFEIGYARALHKKVVILIENVNENDLTMLVGSNCEITHDFSTAMYKASW